jgi:ABC-type Na+ transport system ATPase subunit NatA
VEPGDDVIVLHKGKKRADDSVASLLQATGAEDMKTAFVALTAEQDLAQGAV